MNATGFYVYVYRDIDNNNQPFYVGKGFKNRYCDVGSRKYNMHLYNKIYQLRRKGYKVKDFTTIEKDNMTATDALLLETDLIKTWGRRDLHTGILLNLTDGGDGVVNIKHNPMLLSEKDKIFEMYDDGKTLKEISKIYNCSNISPVIYLFHLFDKPRRCGGKGKPNINYNELVENYKSGIPINELKKKYSCDAGFIRKYLNEQNILVGDGRKTSILRGGSGKVVLQDKKDEIINLYTIQNKSKPLLARYYGVSTSTINKILMMNNIKVIDGRKRSNCKDTI